MQRRWGFASRCGSVHCSMRTRRIKVKVLCTTANQRRRQCCCEDLSEGVDCSFGYVGRFEEESEDFACGELRRKSKVKKCFQFFSVLEKWFYSELCPLADRTRQNKRRKTGWMTERKKKRNKICWLNYLLVYLWICRLGKTSDCSR